MDPRDNGTWGSGAGQGWRPVGTASGPELAFKWPATWNNSRTIATRLRISMRFPGDAAGIKLTRLLLYPAPAATRATP